MEATETTRTRWARNLQTHAGKIVNDALADALTCEVMLNPDGRIWQERFGEPMKCIGTLEPYKAESLFRTLASLLGKTVSYEQPQLDGEYPGGFRFSGALPPIVSAPAFTIRKPASRVFTLDEYVEAGILTERQKDALCMAVSEHQNLLVVGGTGSGKTTIANLIARFYDVTGGAVRIDGIDVRDYRLSSLRKMIGVVNQDAILFNDTIANNIAYGCPSATREEIIEAAKLANAHEFIVDGRHARGYDTEVGEKGFKLSGGEKQRVAIARAILRNPPILILDEATSALDTVTEKLVQEALNRVMANRTVFAIAHRLSTIRNANCIIVLKNGRVAEAGTHAELLAKNGIYRRLHDTQFKMD